MDSFFTNGDGMGAYNRYFGRLKTGKMKIRGVMARKGDTPEYVNRMQQEIFGVLVEARSLEELLIMNPEQEKFLIGIWKAWQVLPLEIWLSVAGSAG